MVAPAALTVGQKAALIAAIAIAILAAAVLATAWLTSVGVERPQPRRPARGGSRPGVEL